MTGSDSGGRSGATPEPRRSGWGGRKTGRKWVQGSRPRSDPDQAHTTRIPRERQAPPPPPRRRPFGDDPGIRGYDRYGTDGYERPDPRRAGPPRGGDRPRPQDRPGPDEQPDTPRRLKMTRNAALRGKELSGKAVDAFQRAHKADGAEESGLTSLSWALMINYASDAALAIALANTLFFSAASAESKWKVALYLVVTIAPFALIAPLIGPALDKIQRGRRMAMAVSAGASAMMCVLIAMNFDSWLLYPAALGKMVLSKSFLVLKSAITPRVVPPDITLAKTNARLTVFGLAAAGAGGTLAAVFNAIADTSGAALFAAALCIAGAIQAMLIPSWVESTEGEVPATLHTQVLRRPAARQPVSNLVAVALWGNGTIRLLTGFLMLFAAFAVKAYAELHHQNTFTQLLMLGIIGAAAGVGGFLGNAIGSRVYLGRPQQIITISIAATLGSTLLAAAAPGVATAAIVGLVGATASALTKISLDAAIQRDLPEQSRASAFGRSETVLQLAWCVGGAIGLLLPPTYWIGFLVISALLGLGLAQTLAVQHGRSLIPGGLTQLTWRRRPRSGERNGRTQHG